MAWRSAEQRRRRLNSLGLPILSVYVSVTNYVLHVSRSALVKVVQNVRVSLTN